MTERQAGKIFEKYNPASAVKRCPNGRAMMRNKGHTPEEMMKLSANRQTEIYS